MKDVSAGNRDGPSVSSGKKPPLSFTLFRDIDPAPRKVFLVDRLLGAGEASCIYGAPGSAKSMLSIDLACHIAAGRRWFDRQVTQGPVLYVAAERAKLVERRLAAFRKHHEEDDLPLAVVAGGVDLCTSSEHVGVIVGYARDMRELTGSSPILIIVDTVSRVLAGGDENSSKDMGSLVAKVGELMQATGAHVLLIHHIPQDGNVRLRGHGNLLGALDTTIAVEAAGSVRTATIKKDNDGADGERLAFALESITLSIDPETGQETKAPVVVPTDGEAPKAQPTRKLSDRQRLALEALVELCLDGEPAPASLGLPAGVRVVRTRAWRDELYSRGILDREGPNPREILRRTRDALQARHLVGQRDDLIWSAQR